MNEEPILEEEHNNVRLETDVLSVVNYAQQLNGLPIVRSCVVNNGSGRDIRGAELRLSARPALCLPFSRTIDCIPAGSRYGVGNIDLTLDGDFLAGMTERVTGLLTVSLHEEGKLIASEEISLTALAFDEWHGSGYYPELLCAFVTPNHPGTAKLTARAAELLGKWTGDPSLDAYQSEDVNRVRSMAAALYGAIQEQNIVYAAPPASFEAAGQRVRLVDTVLEQKMGTCLDLALLYASCLEAMGLAPLLVLLRGHIFAGVWLENAGFAETVTDDQSMLTKRLAEGVSRIAIVECTALTAGKNMDFEAACRAAESRLGEDFEFVLDVHRARASGIRPLPGRVMTADGWRVERDTLPEEELTPAPQEVSVVSVPEQEETPVVRMGRWERKLLDLGLRNTLINLRMSKTLIPLLTSSVDELENALSDGGDFVVSARPSEWQAGVKPDFENLHELGGAAELISAEFKNRRLRSALTEAELAVSIKELYRSAKTALEENGANTFYLALGILRWYENPRSTKGRYAPIVLLPVEIARRSAAEGYVIRLRDEEPQINVTMLEKLRQDFNISVNGLDPLPLDEHGIDIRKVFTAVRMAVMEQKNWDVLESAYLGIFSFSQFVMWNDIKNRSADLAKNKVVSSLMEGRLMWDADPMEMGDRVPEDGVFLPMSADASQLFAIEAAGRGESFVLHGPPGTGKSQTITVMIANALAQGKTVLFVAEKMAALEVVQKRLEKIGIGPFCLELHSNKSRKRDVLEQLRAASEVTKEKSGEAYAESAERIAALRDELDEYARALHCARPCGLTLYELINRYEELKDAEDIPGFDRSSVSALTGQQIARQEELLGSLLTAAALTGSPAGHPLGRVGCTEYTQTLKSACKEPAAAYKEALKEAEEALERFSTVTGLSTLTYPEAERAAELTKEMELWYHLPGEWAKAEDPKGYFSHIKKTAEKYIEAEKTAKELLKSWKPEFLELDGRALGEELSAAANKRFLAKALGVGAVSKKVAPYALGEIDKDTLAEQFKLLARYRDEAEEAKRLRLESGGYDPGENADWKLLWENAAAAQESAEKIDGMTGDTSFRTKFCGVPAYKDAADGLNASWAALGEAFMKLDALLAIKSADEDADLIAEDTAMCDNILNGSEELREWVMWNGCAAEARDAGLGSAVDAILGGMEPERAERACRKELWRSLAMETIDREPVLNRFSGALFEEKIARFKKLDAQMETLMKKEIFCRLAARVPNFAKEAAQSSELGVLQRAIRSGGRGVSIRRLFEQIPNILPRLCPCMLMSPISAAQYLAPDREPFDLVVFDEASQLPTCKAVGALARGRDAVVVGDPKQMPPTSFFSSVGFDEEEPESEDLESILDDCLALNMPQSHLLWHYRSRHESLIAFSNRKFYENKLYTFPSVNDRERKVRLVPVDGVFDRGKTRQNRAEAEAVVEELKRRCHDPEDKKLSAGVVTFNILQQNLIDDLLTEACREDRELEEWAYGSEEPLFIKNLENVQGDERDVILFSVGYGPDKDGKVSMNFGPLNRDGGWRRLNVAVSRSKCEMVVYSTLRPEQIDLARTSAEGVAALRSFLSYAAGEPLPEDDHSASEQEGSTGITESICAALAQKGYRTDVRVGRSGYRVDIGVIDPENADRYALGIMLDGAAYGAARTTRDRELAQLSVLEGLGWKILRAWSMDWWDNSKRELERILAAVEGRDAVRQEEEKIPLAENCGPESEPEKKKLIVPYEPAKLRRREMTTESFLLPENEETIREKLAAIIEAEAPAAESVIVRRLTASCGIARAGGRVSALIERLLAASGSLMTEQADQRFYWGSLPPEEYLGVRTGGGSAGREIKNVPIEEISNAAQAVLLEQVGMSREELRTQTVKLLGYARAGSAAADMIDAGISYAVSLGCIEEGQGDSLILTQEGTKRAETILGI